MNPASVSALQQQALARIIRPTDQSDPLLSGLQAYVVGGAVRDALLGLPAGDRDWVVVDAAPQVLAERGFIPVGGDFPVFLHPHTKEEFALARTERKSGKGYKGFTFYTGPDVTLADDLRRRDLRINAMAVNMQGVLQDPLQGWVDLQQRCLRHVGDAFSEDPVRLLRLARFAARFTDFSIAPETLDLASSLVEAGEVDALVPERVWQEFAKGLQCQQPGRMMQVLQQTGALARIAPGLEYDMRLGDVLAWAHQQELSLPSRYALLCSQSPDLTAIAQALCAPREATDRARLLQLLLSSEALHEHSGPQQWLDLMESCDALRRPERFEHLCKAAQGLCKIDPLLWQERVERIRQIDAAAIARAHPGRTDLIKAALRQARLEALTRPA